MVPLRWISTRAASLAVVFLETVGSLGVRGSTGSALGWDLLLEGLVRCGEVGWQRELCAAHQASWLRLMPDSGVCSPPPALLNPAWICHHRAGALWIWPQAAFPTPVFLGTTPGHSVPVHI